VDLKLDPASLFYLASYVVFVAMRGAFQAKSDARPVVHTERGGLEPVLLALVALGVMIIPIVYIATPWLDAFDFPAIPLIQIVGAAALVAGLILFWRAHIDLETNFSRTLEIRESHGLVTHGVYRLMRHPMYAAIWLFVIGQGLILPNWVAAASGIISFAFMYFLRVPREEALMMAAFGDAYRAYARVTPRLALRFW
jgi:protein-S-isoprenylcysteine O-methyltransferase Ste14